MLPRAYFFHIVILSSILFTTTYCQTNDDSNSDDTFEAPWLFTMVISGVVGIIFITAVGIHSTCHFYRDNTNEGIGRLLYITFFILYVLVCCGYSFFKIDLLIPMGTVIDCKLGFYSITTCVILSKLALFSIFVYRIDLSFHSSALGYPRKFLIGTMVTYLVLGLAGYGFFVFVTLPLVELISAEYTLFGNRVTIGMCTTGTVTSDSYTIALGLSFLIDTIFTIFVCVLFVYKLQKVIKMGRGDRQFATQSENEKQRTRKLTKVIRKQTILVLVASISSFFAFGGGGVIPGLSLMIPVDSIINTCCIWLMFSFADPIWNAIVAKCCFCCICCGKKENYMMTMRTLRGLSIRSRMGSSTTGDNENGNDKGVTMITPSADNGINSQEPLTSIANRHSEKNPDVDINFKNEIQSSDLQKNQSTVTDVDADENQIEMQQVTDEIEIVTAEVSSDSNQ